MGYSIDLLNELRRLEGFEYELQLVQDGTFGEFNETSGQWYGMIGEVARGEADMAMSGITLTREQARVVDFLPIYAHLELSFIIKRSFESNHQYNPFSFFDPFDSTFYRAVILTVAGLSIILSGLSTISPYGIHGRFFQSVQADKAREADKEVIKAQKYSDLTKKDCKILKERDEAQSGMGINNSLFLVWSALFCQSPEQTPQSVSAKIVIIAWFFASTVFIASYTAKVVTSVSLYARGKDGVQTVGDLLLQSSTGYGTVEKSVIATELKNAQSKAAKQIYTTLLSGNSPLHFWVKNISVGVDLAKQGKYAFIGESIHLDWVVAQSNCELKAIPFTFEALRYAIPVRKSLPMYNTLSDHIENLKINGFFQKIWNRYFSDIGACDHVGASKFRSLTSTDLAGVFYFVAAAMSVGCVILILEWLVAAFGDINSLSRNRPHTLREALKVRSNRLLQYFRSHVFSIDRLIKKWTKMRLPSLAIADAIVTNRTSLFRPKERDSGRRVSDLARMPILPNGESSNLSTSRATRSSTLKNKNP